MRLPNNQRCCSYLIFSLVTVLVRIIWVRLDSLSNGLHSAYTWLVIFRLLSRLFDIVTGASIFLALASLNNGIAIAGAIRQPKGNIAVKYMWYIPPTLLAILAVASFAVRVSVITGEGSREPSESSLWDSGKQLNLGLDIVVLIVSTGIMTLSLRTRAMTRNELEVHTVSKVQSDHTGRQSPAS